MGVFFLEMNSSVASHLNSHPLHPYFTHHEKCKLLFLPIDDIGKAKENDSDEHDGATGWEAE